MASSRDMIQFIESDEYFTYPISRIEKCQKIHSSLYLYNQKRYEKEILKNAEMKQLVLAYFNSPSYSPKNNDEIIVGKLIVED